MWYVFGAIALLFFILSVVFHKGKGINLIAGFNTLTKQEKERYDIKKLTKFMSKIMFLLGLTILIMPFSLLFNSTILLWTGIILFVGILIFTLIYANTNNRFKK